MPAYQPRAHSFLTPFGLLSKLLPLLERITLIDLLTAFFSLSLSLACSRSLTLLLAKT